MGSIPFFLNFDDIEKIRPAFIQIRTPFSSEFLEKFSARVQIRTSRSTFLFLFLYFIARKIGFNHDSDKPTTFLFKTVIDKLTIVFNLLR